MNRRIVPSVLSADFARLGEDVELLRRAGAQSVQIDVMDGHFVPNITVGPVVVECLRKRTSIFLDLHLMIENPLQYIDVFAQAGANLLTVHYEACENPAEVIHAIKRLKVQVGMAIRPKTSVEVLYPHLAALDMALVMTVEPGFGGQAFMPEMLEKVKALRYKLGADNPCQIQVDGGISTKTAPLAAQAGANSFVAGSSVYGAPNPVAAFQALQHLVETA